MARHLLSRKNAYLPCLRICMPIPAAGLSLVRQFTPQRRIRNCSRQFEGLGKKRRFLKNGVLGGHLPLPWEPYAKCWCCSCISSGHLVLMPDGHQPFAADLRDPHECCNRFCRRDAVRTASQGPVIGGRQIGRASCRERV